MGFAAEVGALLQSVASACSVGLPVGSMSITVYDTAWVSMISKATADGPREWLFPESFQFLLDAQLPDGSWESYASEIDGILNTGTALLALLWHRNDPLGSTLPEDLDGRISRANRKLAELLFSWDVTTHDQVGFEILVPTLLKLLDQQGLNFSYPQSGVLSDLNAKKLAQFQSSALYHMPEVSMTLVHSLEALVGVIDFDRVAHHIYKGSMMASPSSTAAFLIYGSKWNDEAESYLRDVIHHGPGHGSGSCPSAFPSTIFEVSWMTSTLLEAGVARNMLAPQDLENIADYLQTCLNIQGGTVGFAPGVLSDADDTARAILSLSLLGRDVGADDLVSKFDSSSCFRTYSAERNPSLSANCNILNSLLHLNSPELYVTHINRTVEFLSSLWFQNQLKDKWNHSEHYSTMLLAKAFVQFLYVLDDGRLSNLPLALVSQDVPIVLMEIITLNLARQKADGSWGSQEKSSGTCEETAYCILSMASLACIPWVEPLRSQVHESIGKGRTFLLAHRAQWKLPDALWIEKVSYSSTNLSYAYCLAAMEAPLTTKLWRDEVRNLVSIPLKTMESFCQFYSKLPLFASKQEWLVKAALIEGYMFLPKLRETRLMVFPRKGMAEDKYLEYLPFTWTGCNMIGNRPVKRGILWEMMVLSMLNYQADEFMEAVVGASASPTHLDAVRQIIDRLCAPEESCKRSGVPNYGDFDAHNEQLLHVSKDDDAGRELQRYKKDVENTLGKFTSYIFGHDSVKNSHPALQRQIRHEVSVFLRAHVIQIQDNACVQNSFKATNGTRLAPSSQAQKTYFNWVRTVSSSHTSCPYSFVFFICLISQPGQQCFTSAKQKYFAEDLCTHLACMCRQYNDYGSVDRDKLEGNLNSIQFPEFASTSDEDAKAQLLILAEYERHCLDIAQERLQESELSTEVSEALRLFVRVTDLFGQIYVARDIASRMR
ncbi:MAG: hypothetical protein M1820_007866 [Bogoriella megaspora]|nr:MAG: hypothetical protein M1820_007866 [Bogoriella megaspora]